MKIIEAMKKVKYNKVKISDLQLKIRDNCANLSYETPIYGNQVAEKIKEWIQSCSDLTQENVRLLCDIQATNLRTEVTIEIGDKKVTKSVSEWVWRRREYSKIDQATWGLLTDRGIKDGVFKTSQGLETEVKVVRHFDAIERDKMREIYQSEPHLIDSALEISNAVTDLIENYQ